MPGAARKHNQIMADTSPRSTTNYPRIVFGAIAIAVLALFALQPVALVEWVRDFYRVDRIRLAAYEGDVGALEWIAKDQGFYDKVGLVVDIKGYDSGKAAMEALRAGQADVATASEFVTASHSFSEPDLRVLANISYYRNKGIVARRDRGIEKPADLKGKRIGVTSPSGAEYTLYVFLALNGLGPQDITTVNLTPPKIVESMEKGSIDAAITWQPHVQAIESKLGDGAITYKGDGFDTYLLLLTRAERIPETSPALKKLLRALVLAEDWAIAHPAEAKRYVATRFNQKPEYVEMLWPQMQLNVTLPQELFVAMDGEARWLASKNRAPGVTMPNYVHFVHAEALNAVKPSVVTVVDEPSPRGAGPVTTAPHR
jgi:NitT/TauT family transport system substrate-binding protein